MTLGNAVPHVVGQQARIGDAFLHKVQDKGSNCKLKGEMVITMISYSIIQVQLPFALKRKHYLIEK